MTNIIVFNKKVIETVIKSFKETNPKIRKALAKDFTESRWANQFEIFTNLNILKFIIAGSYDTCIITEYLMGVANKCQEICELIRIKDCGHYPRIENSKYIINKVFT